MTPLLERQVELRRELLILPSSLSPPANNKLESAVGPLAGAAAAGAVGPPPPPASAPSATAGGRRHWRLGRSSKRGRLGDEVNNGEHHGEHSAAAAAADDGAAAERRHSCKRRRKKQQSGTSMRVTSAPDLFDGYQWKKYGQKQIEGAMYPRSYYRCLRSAEQGCAAKRTVQRNDDDGNGDGAGAAAAPMYTVVRMGEHTCTASDSSEAPVILETTAATAGAFLQPDTASTSGNSTTTSTTITTAVAGTESPAISDNTWSTITSSVSDSFMDDYYGGLLAAVHDNDNWVPALAAPSPSSVPTIEDFAGPIRSPVHVYAADGWTIDQLLLQQLVNEPTICQHI